MTDHTLKCLSSLLFFGTILMPEFVRQPLSVGDRSECPSLAARYQTQQRASNFFILSRISAVRGA